MVEQTVILMSKKTTHRIDWAEFHYQGLNLSANPKAFANPIVNVSLFSRKRYFVLISWFVLYWFT